MRWKNLDALLRWTFRTVQVLDQPRVYDLKSDPSKGKGGVALDPWERVGQAGMVLSVMERMPTLQRLALYASYANGTQRDQALVQLAQSVIAGWETGVHSRRLAMRIVQKFFGVRVADGNGELKEVTISMMVKEVGAPREVVASRWGQSKGRLEQTLARAREAADRHFSQAGLLE